MTTYPKIETLFDRNDDFTVNTSKIRRPEFECIENWILTEKVDGTNIRLIFTTDGPKIAYDIRGKSDNASLHPKLYDVLDRICSYSLDHVHETMQRHGLTEYVLFGEGYGEKIQSGGRYRTQSKDQAFVLFDVLANGRWLDEEQVSDTAELLRIDQVPYIDNGKPFTINDAVELVRDGFPSDMAEVFDAKFDAEGVVARTLVPLYDRRGERVIWKLKAKDFRAGKR